MPLLRSLPVNSFDLKRSSSLSVSVSRRLLPDFPAAPLSPRVAYFARCSDKKALPALAGARAAASASAFERWRREEGRESQHV